jgi:aspartate carbamoyltransferase catalytic subunit
MRKNSLAGRDLISIEDLSKEEIEQILDRAKQMAINPPKDLLKGSILASCFFEPSTRTRLSFEAAMHRLGGSVIGFSEQMSTSAQKGESLFDSLRVIGHLADIIVIRHPQEGSAKIAAEAAEPPVINAGDGANQHPTQTLVDLFTILECQGRIGELHIALAGDLKYGRTVHSLALALAHYPVRLSFVSPESLSLPEGIARELRKKGIEFSFFSSIQEILPQIDVLYMTRIQKERFNPEENSFINPCMLRGTDLKKAKPNLRILHPLPRLDELEKSIDATPHAYYFKQAANGLPVRMALLSLLYCS